MSKKAIEIRFEVKNCARCGGNHFIKGIPLKHPEFGEFSHWGTCPNTNEPLLIIIEQVLEDES